MLADLKEIVFDVKGPLYLFFSTNANDVHNYAISFFKSKHLKGALNRY